MRNNLVPVVAMKVVDGAYLVDIKSYQLSSSEEEVSEPDVSRRNVEDGAYIVDVVSY